MRSSDWSSDVCSSDLASHVNRMTRPRVDDHFDRGLRTAITHEGGIGRAIAEAASEPPFHCLHKRGLADSIVCDNKGRARLQRQRSEEHTSELQSLMRNSYAVFCLKKKKTTITKNIKTKQQKC